MLYMPSSVGVLGGGTWMSNLGLPAEIQAGPKIPVLVVPNLLPGAQILQKALGIWQIMIEVYLGLENTCLLGM